MSDVDKEIGKASPTLIVEHYTQEGLANALSHNNEYLALLSSESSGVVDLLRGAKSSGVFQGELLLKGFCGESYDCNKKIASNEHLQEIRMTVNLLGTTGTWTNLLATIRLERGDYFQDLCLLDSRPVPREDNKRRAVDENL